ncbi:MAG: FtsB family cell division protein [Syntrophomonadaceae bacterium]
MSLIKQPRLRLVIFALLLSFFAVTLTPRLFTIWKLSEQKAGLEQKKMEASRINQELILQKDKLDDPAELERIAREQLGMVRKGEKILIEVRNDSP